MSALRDALRRLPDAVFADVLESDDAYLFVIDLPGATGDTVDVHVTDGRLHVEARREKDVPAGFTYRSEDRPLFLDADLPLPLDAGEGDAEATMENGVLEVEIPKTSGRSRSIPVE
ncbi:MAG: Hsp20/alpha crystallin family protein [Halobacteriaceae archaeon]